MLSLGTCARRWIVWGEREISFLLKRKVLVDRQTTLRRLLKVSQGLKGSGKSDMSGLGLDDIKCCSE